MFTIVGWQESKAGTTSYKAYNALADQHVRVDGDIIYVPELDNLVGAYVAGGTIADEGYLSSPSLRRLALLDLRPIQRGLKPSGDESVHLHPLHPIPLESNEGLELYLKETTTTTEVRTGIVFLADGPLVPVTGEIYSVYASATITSEVGVWKNAAISFRQTLPVGRYQIVGARCEGASIVAFRLVFVGGTWRPGGIGCGDCGAHDANEQRYGGLGIWGEFGHMTPPTLEVLGSVAEAQSPELYLDLIKVA